MSTRPRLPWWLKPMNRVMMALQRLGLRMGPVHVISLPGRRSGKPRATPVSVLEVDGRRYTTAIAGVEWVKNARAAGRGVLAYGRLREPVRLVELPPEDRAAILREFPVKIPQAVGLFVNAGVVETPDPDGFAAAAPRCVVFRVEPAEG